MPYNYVFLKRYILNHWHGCIKVENPGQGVYQILGRGVFDVAFYLNSVSNNLLINFRFILARFLRSLFWTDSSSTTAAWLRWRRRRSRRPSPAWRSRTRRWHRSVRKPSSAMWPRLGLFFNLFFLLVVSTVMLIWNKYYRSNRDFNSKAENLCICFINTTSSFGILINFFFSNDSFFFSSIWRLFPRDWWCEGLWCWWRSEFQFKCVLLTWYRRWVFS